MHELTITMDSAGLVNVHGPVTNRALCEAMLAAARVVLEDFARKQQVIEKAPIDLQTLLRNGGEPCR